ncbi:Trypsin-like peptidase domain-containing protein [Sinosporangium album]|uniref:Trypsin-like peptidase domain-containing protein n=1 Tax=Sinosporangium album TaxID=504805 RepID=A0A1G8H8F0_9ACTN|nr:trypsin-like serine protease [Sinosporangium album]SDI02926.1 Trypsin-like peptidase domain-containing protein [Sinosporangium album]
MFPRARRFLAVLSGLAAACALAAATFPAAALATPPYEVTEEKVFTIGLAKTAAEAAKVADYWRPDRIKQAEEQSPASPGSKIVTTPSGSATPKPSLAEAGAAGTAQTTGATQAQTAGTAPVAPKTIGKVFFKFNSKEYWCSATSVSAKNRSLVATAAHCAYDVRRGEPAQYWIFVPNPESGIANGIYVGRSISMHEDFPGKGDYDYDYAFVTVHKGFTWVADKDAKGAVTYRKVEVGRLQDKVGGLKVDTQRRTGNPTYAFGYPSGPQPDGSRPFNGRSVQVCSGTTSLTRSPSYQLNLGLLINNCTFTAGASGGPWLIDYNPATGEGFLNGVNSLSWNLKPDGKYDAISSGYFSVYALATYRHAEKLPIS